MTLVSCLSTTASLHLKLILRHLGYHVMGMAGNSFNTNAPQPVIDAASVLVDEHIAATK